MSMQARNDQHRQECLHPSTQRPRAGDPGLCNKGCAQKGWMIAFGAAPITAMSAITRDDGDSHPPLRFFKAHVMLFKSLTGRDIDKESTRIQC
jgi:hypothetical protein